MIIDTNMYATANQSQNAEQLVTSSATQAIIRGSKNEILIDWGQDIVTDSSTSMDVAEDEIRKIIEQNQAISDTELKDGEIPQLTTTVGVVTTQTTKYSVSLESVINIQANRSPKISSGSSWVNATRGQVQQYVTPNNNNIQNYKYQFLDLSSPAGITEQVANTYLSGKGILSGRGSYFIIAANKYNVNEVYLMAHAQLETGNGTSALAKGYNYKGVTVYNMYGIGAVDGSALTSGAAFAYNMGWTTPEAAIVEGAKWISQNYINNTNHRQNTLYKMRWNPANPGSHQYATDVAWATKQAKWIQQIYAKYFPNANLRFDIPVYAS